MQDVAAVVTLFETYFDFKCTLVKGDHVIAILTGKDNFSVVLMTATDGNINYPKAFHIGFMQDSDEAVSAVYERLKAGNIQLQQEPQKMRGSFGFYFHFDVFMIEVGVSAA